MRRNATQAGGAAPVPRMRRNDRGSALVFAAWLMASAGLGVVALPRAAALADRVAARADLTMAAHEVQMVGVPASSAALAARLREDDPALSLSGTTVAGAPSILPGSVGIAADGQEAVLAVRAGGECFQAVVTNATVHVTERASSTAAPCEA